MSERNPHNLDRFITQALDIQETPADEAKSLAFLTKFLVLATLPHRNPRGNPPAWTRRNGNFSLTIRPGWDSRKEKYIGYPYGSIPRLLMFWLTGEVLRTKSRRIELGNNLTDFMREIGLNPDTGGGKRSDARRLRNQMERLFQAIISFDYSDEKQTSWLNIQIAPKGQLFWDHKQPDQSDIFGSWIELGEDFYNALMAAPVPLDMRALRALKQSPLSLDLYAYLTHRVSYLRKKTVVSWKSLEQQFGGNYSDTKNFTRSAKVSLRDIQLVYPDLNIDMRERGRLIIHPSPTHIRPLSDAV